MPKSRTRKKPLSNSHRYRRGVQFERARRDAWKELGGYVIRSAGSRGAFDLCVIQPTNVTLIQCKRCQNDTEADRLMGKFAANPPLLPGPYHQVMECYVVETGEVRSTTI